MMKKLSRVTAVVLCITLTQSSSSMMTVARKITSRPCTPLKRHYTQQAQDIQPVQDILKNAYNKNKWTQTKTALITHIKEDPRIINMPEFDGSHGYTPLCYALMHNDLLFTYYLLENGANPNDTLRETYASSPIFFAQSVEALTLLEQFGAQIDTVNKESGIFGGMNLLHASTRYTTTDEHIFDHCLKKGLNPQSLTLAGGTLWHSLIDKSARYLPEETIIARAYKIKTLGINPDQKNNYRESALLLVQQEVEADTAYINSGKVHPSILQHRIDVRNKMQKLLTFMETQN